jgi:hypothetical protein
LDTRHPLSEGSGFVFLGRRSIEYPTAQADDLSLAAPPCPNYLLPSAVDFTDVTDEVSQIVHWFSLFGITGHASLEWVTAHPGRGQ